MSQRRDAGRTRSSISTAAPWAFEPLEERRVLTGGAEIAPRFSPDVPSITISAPTIQVTESATQNVTGYFDVLIADTKSTDKLDGFQVDLTTPDPTKIQLTTADILTSTTPTNFYGASASYVLTGFSPSPGASIINNSATGTLTPDGPIGETYTYVFTGSGAQNSDFVFRSGSTADKLYVAPNKTLSSGTYEIEIKVSDSKGQDTKSFTLTVN